jgi:hypothetical protein
MHKARFWFGTAMAVVPVLSLLLAMALSVEVKQSGPIEGHVSFHGRPLPGASVLFIPEDTPRLSWGLGCADENGHYVLGSEWHREIMKGKLRFRICVMPDYRDPSLKAAPGSSSAGIRQAQSGATTAGIGTMSVASGLPRPWSDPKTTQLEVQLDSGPAQVDIAL